MRGFYEELDHTADWAIRVTGKDLNGLFANAALAMFELQGLQPVAEPVFVEHVTCRADDLGALLVTWLNELLFLSEINDALYALFEVEVTQTVDEASLQAVAHGIPGRGHLAHVKAVTYWDLRVEPTATGWAATVTFDT